MDYPKLVKGDHLKLPFPTYVEVLEDMGVDFLTDAFRASGAIGQDNSVKEITEWTEFFGGGMGRKVCLTVTYEKDEDGLHNELFAKFPREFGDPLRELFSPVMEPEVQFALLSRQPGFPIAVPKCYYADYQKETLSGLLITEKIAFGEGNIQPFHDKCLDYQIDNPLKNYQAIVKTIAKLAGTHKAGNFGDIIDQQFPYDPSQIKETDLIPYTVQELQEKLDKLISFTEQYPQLFPEHIRDKAFLKRFSQEALVVKELDVAIKRHLNQQTDYIALSHWNGNIDNGWFWKNEQGELEAGLLDWGAVSQMNVAQSLFGIFCAAETDFLNDHKHALIDLFSKEYQHHSGVTLNPDELSFYINLSMAVLGVAWMLDAPSIIESQLTDLDKVKDRFDPAFSDCFLARAQLQLLVVFLNEWQVEDLGAVCRKFAQMETD